MARSDPNALGDRGEIVANYLLTNWGGRSRPLFRTRFLGEKWPTLDFYVEVYGDAKVRAYFFVQVKTTYKGKSSNVRRLSTGISKNDVARMMGISAPTYVVGVDARAERGYIISVHPPSARGFGSIPTKYPLTFTNLLRLKAEVVAFWKRNRNKPQSSVFGGN